MSPRVEAVSFAGPNGHQLSGRLDLPAGVVRSVALFAHCFSCGKDLRAAARVAARLTDHGFAVLRFDFTGLGRSEGDFADTNFSSNVSDLVVAADWLRQTYGPPSLLMGHSLGGTAALAAAAQIPELAAVVTIGAPADPGHVAHLFDASVEEIRETGSAEVRLGGRPFTVKQQFLDDVCSQNIAASLAEMKLPLLVVHSPQDDIVPVHDGIELFAKANHPKSFISLDGADHLLSDLDIQDRVGELIAHWAVQYMPDRVVPSNDVLVPASEGEVVVAERGTGPFAQVVRVADRHVLLADEPIGIGDDTGPAPYDFLLAALGSCTSMTIRMYAERKGWPLEHVALTLRHNKVHATDCAECESAEGRVDVIERDLVIEGPLTDEQRSKLVEIADKCPVHRTLRSETLIITDVVN